MKHAALKPLPATVIEPQQRHPRRGCPASARHLATRAMPEPTPFAPGAPARRRRCCCKLAKPSRHRRPVRRLKLSRRWAAPARFPPSSTARWTSLSRRARSRPRKPQSRLTQTVLARTVFGLASSYPHPGQHCECGCRGIFHKPGIVLARRHAASHHPAAKERIRFNPAGERLSQHGRRHRTASAALRDTGSGDRSG